MVEKVPGSKSPLSIPLNKGEMPRPTGKNSLEPFNDISSYEKSGHMETNRGLPFWKLLLAMLLFPFFFQAGTELYNLARADIVSRLNPKKTSEPMNAANAGKQADGLALEKLSAILANQTKMLEEGAGKVVVIQPPLSGQFSFDAEKAKIYDLSGINMDDPVSGANKLAQVKSVELLYSLMESFDRIVQNAVAGNISDFHVKNAIEWKKRALKRLQELR